MARASMNVPGIVAQRLVLINNVCGIVIHALASLLGVVILIHWLADDNKLEWMIGLASLQHRNWSSHQMGLRWVNSFITKYKRVSVFSILYQKLICMNVLCFSDWKEHGG